MSVYPAPGPQYVQPSQPMYQPQPVYQQPQPVYQQPVPMAPAPAPAPAVNSNINANINPNITNTVAPVQNTNVTVVTQPTETIREVRSEVRYEQKLILGSIYGHRTWTTDMLSCCEDCQGCLITCCFPMCTMYAISARLGESTCTACLPGSLVLLRTKTRTLGGIKGTICGDYCATTCFPTCVLCQLDRELKNMGL